MPNQEKQRPDSASTGVARGLAGLAALVYRRPTSVDDFIEGILALLAGSLQVGQVHITRIQGDTLQYERIHDRAGMPIHEGDEIPLSESYCHIMLQNAQPSMVIENARTDERVRSMACTTITGIGAYSGVPLYDSGGSIYGTLCALHPESRPIPPDEPFLLTLAGRIIMQAVDAGQTRHQERVLEAHRLQESEQRFLSVAQAANDAIVAADNQGTIVFWNGAATRIFGYTGEEILGENLTRLMPDQYREAHRRGLQRYLTTGESQIMGTLTQLTGLRMDGSEFPMELSLASWHTGDDTFFSGVIRDISERMKVEEEHSLLLKREQEARQSAESAHQALRETAERYRTLVTSSPDAILLADPTGLILFSNEQAWDMFGYANHQAFIGISLLDLVDPLDRQRAAENLHRRWTLQAASGRNTEYLLLRQDGSTFPAEVSSSTLTDDDHPLGLTLVIRDITERKRAEEQLRHQALHDSLTDLPNRTLLLDRLQQAIAGCRRDHGNLTLVLLDLDHFKDINDTFGHQYGDLLLQQLGTRLRPMLRDVDTMARLGGDEFALLLPDSNENGAIAMTERIMTALQEPFSLDGNLVEVRTSIGIVVAPEHGEDGMTLLRRADVAMYAAKRSDSRYTVYRSDVDHYSPKRLMLVRELRQAIESNALQVAYQPRVAVQTGKVVGVEALARWHHPLYGWIPPDEFIPLAEHSGLISPLTHLVLERALHQCRVWRDSGMEITMSVNLSARTFHDPHLVSALTDSLGAWSIDPETVQLELTESAIMANPFQAIETLSRLRRTGIRIAIDDFGTGYSSLAYLKRVPADEVKIDKSFVMHMDTDTDDSGIVMAVIDIAHHLGLEVVAEGVETREALHALRGMGCDLAQGYFFSEPLLEPECTQWLESAAESRRNGEEWQAS